MRSRPLVQIPDGVILRAVGPHAFHRAGAYANASRVSDVKAGPSGEVLLAKVQGGSPQRYQTIVWLEVEVDGRVTGAQGSCTCPVGVNCKHVAATMLMARSGDEAPPPVAVWEGRLSALVEAESDPDRSTGTPIALQFEVSGTPTSSRHGMASPTVAGRERIRLRPVVPGRAGGWIRTGVSWRDLAYDVWTPRVRAHREALRDLYAAYTARGTAYSYGDQSVYLDEFGSSLWPLLTRAVEAGVEFVAAKQATGPIRLAPEPATVALDVVQRDDGAAARLSAVVTADGRVWPAVGVRLIGRPLHGVVVDRRDGGGGLLLAQLERALNDSVGQLVAAGDPIEIPAADLERFLHVYYPRLRRAVALTSSDGSVQLPELTPPRLGLTVTHLSAPETGLDWHFGYRAADAVSQVSIGDSESLPELRDLSAERTLLSDVVLPGERERTPSLWRETGGQRRLVPTVRLTGLEAASFVSEMLPELLRRDDLDIDVIGTAPDYRHTDSTPVVRLSATDAPGGPDWFDLDVTVSVDGEDIPFPRLFAALALGESHLILDSGTFFGIERPEYDELRRLIEEARSLQDRESPGLRVSAYQAGLWADLARLGVVERQSERWARTVDGLLGVDSIPRPPAPAALVADLRPYQRAGFDWLAFLLDNGLGGILADDMGLGKTVQALALMCRAAESGPLSGPFLVVAPTSVVHNWATEAARFAPSLRVAVVTETERRRTTGIADLVRDADVVVTSYALFRIDYDSYDALPWTGLILDEAQYVKNHLGKTYQCARRLEAPFKLAITGTPLENSLMDLWSLLSIVAPGLFPSPQRFTEQFRKPIERGTDPELLTRLRRRIRPLMLRRTKEQVLTELPPKQEQVLEVDLLARHAQIYSTHLQRERQKVLGLIGDMEKNRFAIFRSLTLLRQLSLAPALVDARYADVRSSKVESLLEQLEEVVREGHRALVFSQFTGFLALVRKRLDAERIGYCYLDGRTRNRAAQIDGFKAGDAPVFLISLKAGGFGLNLTEADYCFVLDPWWNPAVEAQAVDRAHRIGQARTVMVYRLVATGTIEEKVMQLKARKQDLFDKVMSEDALATAALTSDDIRALLDLS